jgi:hypothetical protein
MYDAFFDAVLGFNKESFVFNSPVKRVYETYKINENTVLITLNLLGIRSEDTNVDIKNVNGLQILKVSATTHNKLIDKKYSYSNELTIGSSRREVESFDWETRDGILYIVLKYKKLPEVKKIKFSGNKNLLGDLEKEIVKEDKKEE